MTDFTGADLRASADTTSAKRRELLVAEEARRILVVRLLGDGHDVAEVMLSARVSWRTLSAWCHGPGGKKLVSASTVARIEREAEEVTATRSRSADRIRVTRGDGLSVTDLAYRHKIEELKTLKTEYEKSEGTRCEPYTQQSSHEIDHLQGLTDNWFG